MKKILLVAFLVLAPLLIAEAATQFSDACPISSPIICITSARTPDMGTPALVTVTVAVTDPNAIPASLNLQRLGADGKVVAILGYLKDDGTNGDEYANDGMYTIQLNMSESDISSIPLRASMALRGQIRRVISEVDYIEVVEEVLEIQ